MVDYLSEYKDIFSISKTDVIERPKRLMNLMSLEECKQGIESFIQSNADLLEDIQTGSVVDLEITGIMEYGIFGKFGNNISGFIHKDKLNPLLMQSLNVGDRLKAEVLNYSPKDARYTLSANVAKEA